MTSRALKGLAVVCVAAGAAVAASQLAAAPPLPSVTWTTVVNNNDDMPGSAPAAGCPLRKFNSYNQPSVNQSGLVVIRARSRGGMGRPPCGGQPTHGIYTRDMGSSGPVVKVIDRTSLVPYPNNQAAKFIETPSFPRIDLASGIYAFRGNSQPVWREVDEDEPVGTSGVYVSDGEWLVTGASKLGGVPDFGFYAVPGLSETPFEVFPGAPSVTGSTIVFKGNYTDAEGAARTGVFFRELTGQDGGGSAPVRAIGTSGSTVIPGTTTVFGSLSPPSAAHGKVTFAGYDDEASPTLGGIYVAPAAERPTFTAVASIGSAVPDWTSRATPNRFNRLGEAVSFDGRFVAFWGAWGDETREVTVTCPTEGNKPRQELCMEQNGGNPEYTFQVPVHQGVFVHDIVARRTWMAAETGTKYLDFVYWGFTGKVEGSIEGDDGEPARWRSSSYVAVSGGAGAVFRVAFKATTPDGVGLYMAAGPGPGFKSPMTLVDTDTPGQTVDPEAAEDAVVSEIGIERDGFRGDWLAINARLLVPEGTEEDGMAGVYVTRVPWP